MHVVVAVAGIAQHDADWRAHALGTVGVLQYFLVPLVLNNGSGRLGDTTFFFNIYLYKTFFTFQDMSFGATLAWLLFVVILGITLLLFWSARFWVYYAGETK